MESTTSYGSTAPAVTVVIPCYNLGAYLDEAVQSVLDQTFDDFEIIVVDDGSTDAATRHLFESFVRPKTRVLRTSNQGLARARNAGLREARGRYISFLDADDKLAPDFLARSVQVLEGNPDLAFASCWLRTFGVIDFEWKPKDCRLPWLLAEDTVCTAALTRRSALEAVAGFDDDMPLMGYEDWDLAITLVERGLNGTIIPEFLFRYRVRPESMTSSCTAPENHAVLMRYLVNKHAASYKLNLHGVLRTIEARTDELEQSIPVAAGDAAWPRDNRLAFAEATLRSLLASQTWRWSAPIRNAIAQVLPGRRPSNQRFEIVVAAGDGDAEAMRRTLSSLYDALREGGSIVAVAPRAADPLLDEVIKRYGQHQTRVIRTAETQPAAQRALGLERTAAAIVFAVNAGDEVETATLTEAVRALESNPQIGFVTAGVRHAPTGFTWWAASASVVDILSAPRIPFPVMRRALLEQLEYDGESPDPACADLDLTIRLAESGARGAVLERPIVESESSKPEGGQRASSPATVIRKHQKLADQHWDHIILTHENQRRALQAHLEALAEAQRPLPRETARTEIDWGALRRLEPISRVWGLDRGQPVDRYYISKFLDSHRPLIRGRVLEVKDSTYTNMYGEGVSRVDIVDIAATNSAATLVGDLLDPNLLPPNRFDCFILTQTLHFIYDMPAVIANAAAALAPGGALLATLPCVSRVDYEPGVAGDFWRVTAASARRLFAEIFGAENVDVHTFGNVLVCNAFLLGLSTEDLTVEELEHFDPYFPLITCVSARKGGV